MKAKRRRKTIKRRKMKAARKQIEIVTRGPSFLLAGIEYQKHIQDRIIAMGIIEKKNEKLPPA